eukprot:TRINITY_DN14557_c0_g1_i3.p1 TRINITY_DN14557_c0_g1~~TRINITY_DN14557_c0_g1_i3.p1  ORF type:complete len:329 (+),score=72.03 TRINITY_DN14557_c0_g1_i3:134-1120(+)
MNMWLAAENGMFLRHTKEDWITTMPEHLNTDWFESVELVFDYFCERTPRSYVERRRETSLVWNYKYADVEFGRVQARDMLQHLWTGPISNAAVDVVQGGKSVEVRPVGLSKGAAIERILGEIVNREPLEKPIDFVMVIGHFLSKDEDIYTFFEPEVSPERSDESGSGKPSDGERRSDRKNASGRGGERSIHGKNKHHLTDKLHRLPGATKANSYTAPSDRNGGRDRDAGTSDDKRDSRDDIPEEGISVIDLKGENYFSCAVGRKRSAARYSLGGSEEVYLMLKALADGHLPPVEKGQENSPRSPARSPSRSPTKSHLKSPGKASAAQR